MNFHTQNLLLILNDLDKCSDDQEQHDDVNETTLKHYISDIIKVSVIPEKKGNALWKHTEYEVSFEFIAVKLIEFFC